MVGSHGRGEGGEVSFEGDGDGGNESEGRVVVIGEDDGPTTPIQARLEPFCEDGRWVEGGTRLCRSGKDNTRDVRPETIVDRQQRN